MLLCNDVILHISSFLQISNKLKLKLLNKSIYNIIRITKTEFSNEFDHECINLRVENFNEGTIQINNILNCYHHTYKRHQHVLRNQVDYTRFLEKGNYVVCPLESCCQITMSFKQNTFGGSVCKKPFSTLLDKHVGGSNFYELNVKQYGKIQITVNSMKLTDGLYIGCIIMKKSYYDELTKILNIIPIEQYAQIIQNTVEYKLFSLIKTLMNFQKGISGYENIEFKGNRVYVDFEYFYTIIKYRYYKQIDPIEVAINFVGIYRSECRLTYTLPFFLFMKTFVGIWMKEIHNVKVLNCNDVVDYAIKFFENDIEKTELLQQIASILNAHLV